MTRPALQARAERALERLDARLEWQTFGDGADAPTAVAIVGAYHRAAGATERAFKPDIAFGRADWIAARLRLLRRLVRDHALVVSQRALVLQAQRRAAAARAREQGGR